MRIRGQFASLDMHRLPDRSALRLGRRSMTSSACRAIPASAECPPVPFPERPMVRLTTSFRATLLSAALALASGGALAADAMATQDFLAAHMDTSVDPGVDFFQYANGGWLKAHPIPAS